MRKESQTAADREQQHQVVERQLHVFDRQVEERQADAVRAADIAPVVEQDLGQQHQGNGGDEEGRPAGAERDQADQEAEGHCDQAAEREGDEGRDAVIGEEDRRRVAADREEDVVAERDVAGIAADDVPARGDGDVHEHEQPHVQPVVHAADRDLEQREEERGEDESHHQPALARRGRRDGALLARQVGGRRGHLRAPASCREGPAGGTAG